MPTHEEKRDAFLRILEGRLPKAIKAIDLLANLSNKSSYAWTTLEVNVMLDELEASLATVYEAFDVKVDEPGVDAPAALAPEPDGVVAIDQRHEVKWAYDCLKRGDATTAKARLHRVLSAWQSEAGPD